MEKRKRIRKTIRMVLKEAKSETLQKEQLNDPQVTSQHKGNHN